MVTCDAFRGELYELTAEELPPGRREELMGHAGGCPGCAAELRTYQATVQLGRRLPVLAPPAGLLARFLSAVEAGQAMAVAR